MDCDIEELPCRLRNLDEAAFRDFSRAFSSRLRRYFLSLGACPADAESLTVSVISDVAMKIDQFEDRGPGSFSGWVFRIARNSWVNDRRRTIPSLTYDVADRVPPDASSAAAQEIAAALNELSETDRFILTARYFEAEPSFAEIGKRVGMTANAVRVRHFRLIRRLSVKLAPFAPSEARGTTPLSSHEDAENG